MGEHQGDYGNGGRRWARAAGVGYLTIIVTGIYAEFFVRSRIIVPEDAGATAANLSTSEMLFRTGIAADLVMLVSDVFVAVALYVVFRDVDRNLALLAGGFRIAHAAVYGATLLFLYVPVMIVGNAESFQGLGADQLEALVLILVRTHGYGYVIALVFFGVYCFLLGILAIRSAWVPKVLGYLLILASVGYLVDSFGQTLLPTYSDYSSVFQMIVFGPAFVGELSFAAWLVVKGGSTAGRRLAGGAGPDGRAASA